MKTLEALLGSVALLMTVAIAGKAVFNLSERISQESATPTAETVATQVAAATTATDLTPSAGEEAAAPAMTLSVAAGERVFKKCKACHTTEQGGADKTGPNLWGVVGRTVASKTDFEGYSDPMRALGDRNWDVALLEEFLTKPKALVAGTKMSFGGLKSEEDRKNVILYLAQHADTPMEAAELGFDVAAPTAVAAAEDAAEATTGDMPEEELVELEEIPYAEGVTYANPPGRTAEEQAEIDRLAAELAAVAPTLDYERSRFHPIHFPPLINSASNEECLACHQEILTHKPRPASQVGVDINDTLAWYQTLDTYAGEQETFHYRHLESDFAKQVMNLDCVFCHKGNDPREETPDMIPTRAAFEASATPEFTLRKMVNPETTCLRCHGQFPYEVMDLEGPWHEIRADLEYPEAPNGCMSCHAEGFRTERHKVDYLNAANIEELARNGSADTCYGCHGGRAWYRISYPYPRHAWPDMDEDVPEWAVDRPTQSDPEYALPAAAE